MAYIIQTVDKPGSSELRAKLRPEHIAYLDANIGKLLAAGGLLNDEGTGILGSLIVVDTDEREVAEALIRNDPLNKGGLFDKVTVTRWRKVYFDRKKVV